MSFHSIDFDSLPRWLLLSAIRFYRRLLSGRGPFARVSCTFGALESCSAFAERVAVQSPSTFTALLRIARRLRRCRHLSLYCLRGGRLGWGRDYDRFVESSPLKSIPGLERKLRRDGETPCVCEAVGRAARRVAIESGRIRPSFPEATVTRPIPWRDATAVRRTWRRRLFSRLAVASAGGAATAALVVTGVGGFAAMTASLVVALLAGLSASAARRELKRLEVLEVLARLEVAPTESAGSAAARSR